MANYPQSTTGLNYISYPAGPTADGTQLVANASANTKGSYVELVASSPFRCNRLLVEIIRTQAVAGLMYLFDIAVGGAGSEVVILPNLMAIATNISTSISGSSYFELPVDIPAGTRISARCQCSTGSSEMFVSITLIAAGDTPGLTGYSNYGSNIVDSGGVTIDPGGTANTKGSYVEISASIAAIIQVLTIMLNNNGNTDQATAIWLIDIATGGAGSEVVLIPDLKFQIGGGSAANKRPTLVPGSITLLTYIAAGTRLAARASCSTNDATSRLCNIALLAGTAPSEPSSGGEHSSVF